ncbi:hypothetical protein PPERSA_00155 [Pseudocohnilembus persalinus]|uniref:Uncharacterized protein n=1 Tax=Pseudocohnilembus persalinus TaxID=266149 RepID=A0A0V0QHX6_PSEPJ|nr:hypothetical protein PPERSA_00155 [Pseudocohnilembus persalinus]|eukprot:KRX01782.1 hypothetical protein PPERSA_00155 [Pseudocohnilembus persalinus]
MKKKMQKSYQAFFELLFQKSTEEIENQLLKGAVQAEDFLEIKEKTLKDLYEKFCYLNHFVEVRLSDKKVIQYLKQKYNYKFVPDHAANQLFLKIAKRRKIQLFSSEQLKQGNSLENFLKINYEITGRETDDVWVEQLHQEYTNFCAENRLVLQNFRAKDVQQKYKLELTTKSQLKLVMDKVLQEQETEENEENFNNKQEQKSFQIEDFANEEQKLIKGQKLNQSEKNQRPTQKLVKNGKYLIRKDFLQHHFNLMAGILNLYFQIQFLFPFNPL